MKIIYFLCILMITPLIVHAETCTDFDDNGDIIEYDCSRSFADVQREYQQKEEEIKRQKAAEELARKTAQQEAERRARQKEQEQRQVERAARRKAKEDKRQSYINICNRTKNFWDCTIGRDYYIAFAPTSSSVMDGYTGEIGIKFNNVRSNWYLLTSLSLENVDGTESGGTMCNRLVSNEVYSISIDSSKQSIALGLGVGYKIFNFWDVYGKVAPGVYFGKISHNALGGKTIKKTSFDVGLVLGTNLRLFKWVNLYAEGQASPFGFGSDFNMDVYGVYDKNGFHYEGTNEFEMTHAVNLTARIGVKFMF